MFSRHKSGASSSPSGSTDPVAKAAEIEGSGTPSGGGPTGKGRPTPKRNVAQAANKRPLVPNDRKAATKAAREKAREQRNIEYRAMQTGDERHLPPRDKGPEKRFVRDYVDARWNLGEFFLPVAFGFIVLNFLFLSNATMSIVILMLLYGVVLLTIADAFLLWHGLKKRMRAKFGVVGTDGKKSYVPQKGTMMYAVMRAFQIRRSRLPRPSSKKHGVWPE
ncbi:DUF3043 domain-containing protein [Isoptericola sp. NEAU-Y5]|uniref:DUF3043 domain-containing protein n=1 Tax=Isoptericola luteus TaxID=2879484 RepID=A0ABS7ZNA9_9MICO|nr:DUF3043 domain-containing protein [Isoptericola sp. NEAU-Y5]MCA5895250.1 DUF3043 domain-containing protein [Isoptericola sp. NEAU-Y5]